MQNKDFIDGLQEPLERKRLQQVVHGIEVETFHGIFAKGGSKDDERMFGHGAQHFEARNLRHFDIEKDQSGFFDIYFTQGITGGGIAAYERETVVALHI